MKRTFNTKIIIFTIALFLVTVAVSSVYITDSAQFEDKDYLFVPLIVGLILTLLRTYNNISEKSKIVQKLATERENSLDQSKIKFTTCPDYWTKETKGGATFCRNDFVDRDGDTNIIGGPLAQASGNIDPELVVQDDNTSNIGFAFAHSKTDDVHTFEDSKSTYIPFLRNSSNEELIEEFDQSLSSHDTVPHKHTRTFVDYAHTDKPVEWKDGEDREHDKSSYKDGDHLLIYNEDVYHDHTGNGNLYDAKGNLIWGRAVMSKSKSGGESADDIQIEDEFDRENNWISPLKKNNYMHAEINLDELNTKDNKCHLVKQFSWNEAKTKCDNVNIPFDQ